MTGYKKPPRPIGPTDHEIVVWLVQSQFRMILSSNIEKIALLSGFPTMYRRMLFLCIVFGLSDYEIVVWLVRSQFRMGLSPNIEKIALLSGFPTKYRRMLFI